MALFDNISTTQTQPPKKKKLFEGEGGLFANLPTGQEEDPTQSAIGETLRGMLTGSAFTDQQTKNRETFQRGADNLRAQSGEQNAAFLGQGSANRAQQDVEQSIFSSLAANELDTNIAKNNLRTEGVKLATDIGTAQQTGQIQREQLQQQAEQFGQNLGLQQQQLEETARQFNISTEQTKQQFKDTLAKDYAALSQNERQFIASLGLDEAKFNESKAQFKAQLGESARQFDITSAQGESQFTRSLAKDYAALSQNEKQFLASLGLDEAKFNESKAQFQAQIGLQQKQLTETARQFNISTEQATNQFAQSLAKDYAALSQNERQFLATLGFDKAKFAESQYQFQATLNKEYAALSQNDKQFLASLGLDEAKFNAEREQFQSKLEQENRLTMAQLTLQERQIAEEARQFNTKADFDRYALEANLNDAEKNRIWQATQNYRAAENNKEITQMTLDTERWKTDRAEQLTKAGWAVEDARQLLDIQAKTAMQDKEVALQREIEAGRLNAQDADRVQQASQFRDELAWQKEATRLGLSADEAARAWQTNERLSSQAYTAGEAQLDRQIQKEIEAGRISLQERELAQQASQFDTQQEWLEKAKSLDLDEAAATRLWQSSENAKEQVFTAQMQQVENAFTEKGWSFTAVMNSLDDYPPEQAAQILADAAMSAGMSYTVTDEKGLPMLDAEGNPITRPGLRTIAPVAPDLKEVWTPGKTIRASDYKSIISNIDRYVDSGAIVADNAVESFDPIEWNTNGANRWTLTSSSKKWVEDMVKNGKLYQASNGKLYEVVGTSTSNKGNTKAAIVFKDVLSGITFNYTRGSKFPGA